MPKQPPDLARLLLRKAEEDLKSARLLLDHDELLDPACFHIQQAAEKLLKALLTTADVSYPFTHDLGALLALALPRFPSLDEFTETVPHYTDFAVAARYDEAVSSSREDLVAALEIVERLRHAVFLSGVPAE